MRRKCVFLMFLATLAMFSCTVSKTSQKRSEQQALKAQVIRQQVDAQHYEIRVRQAFPLGRSPLTFSESFSLTISGDSIISYLPFRSSTRFRQRRLLPRLLARCLHQDVQRQSPELYRNHSWIPSYLAQRWEGANLHHRRDRRRCVSIWGRCVCQRLG